MPPLTNEQKADIFTHVVEEILQAAPTSPLYLALTERGYNNSPELISTMTDVDIDNLSYKPASGRKT